MRFVTIAVFVTGIAVGACNRTDGPVATTGSATTAGGATTAGSATSAGNASTAASATVAAAAPGTVASPNWREVTIPAGTHLPVVLETNVASDKSHAEERVQARLARAVVVEGVTALPEGSRVTGVVTDAEQAGKVKGRAHVAVRFDSIAPRGDDDRYAIRTSEVGRTAPATKKKDALEIGAPAAGGALIGALVGGRKGALIGTGVGGGAGTAYVLSTRGEQVRLAKGAALTVQLTAPLTVKVRG